MTRSSLCVRRTRVSASTLRVRAVVASLVSGDAVVMEWQPGARGIVIGERYRLAGALRRTGMIDAIDLDADPGDAACRVVSVPGDQAAVDAWEDAWRAAEQAAGLLVSAILTVDETEKAFANIYSTAVSVRNFAPRAPQTPIVIVIGIVVTLGALVISLDRFFDFLYLLGAIFVPLFGAVFADRIRPLAPRGTIVAWISGFVLYEWLSPTNILGLSDHIAPLFGGAIGATLPSFLLAAVIRLAWPVRR